MIFEGINFNSVHWKGKSEASFIAHESHHGLGEKKLKEAYSMMNPPEKKEATQAVYKPSVSKVKKD